MPSQTVEQLRQIFNAEAVALVGASDKEGSFGRLFLEGLRDTGCKRISALNGETVLSGAARNGRRAAEAGHADLGFLNQRLIRVAV